MNIVTVLPAAGNATRFGGITKELLPIGEGETLLSRHIKQSKALGEVVLVSNQTKYNIHLRQYDGTIEFGGVEFSHSLYYGIQLALDLFSKYEYVRIALPDTYVDYGSIDPTIGLMPDGITFHTADRVDYYDYSWFDPETGNIRTKERGSYQIAPVWCTVTMPRRIAYQLLPCLAEETDYDSIFNEYPKKQINVRGFWDCGTFSRYCNLLDLLRYGAE